MKMRLFSMMVSTSLLLGGLVMAQDQAPAPAPNAPAVKAGGGALHLTAAQKQQMKSIRQSAVDQAAIIKHDTTLTPAQQDEKLKALRADTREKMKAVLTPEQQKAAANRKASVEERLGLTEDQKTRMRDVAKAAKQQRESVLNNTGLSQEDKAAQLKKIREDTHAQMAQILTPEQQKKMQRFRGMRRHGMRGQGMDL